MAHKKRRMPEQKPTTSEQVVGTPRDFLDAVEARYGKLDVDLAATKKNAKAPVFITRKENSFNVDWATRFPNKVCWLNPTFNNLGAWFAKCHEELQALLDARSIVLCLTPACISTRGFREHVWGNARVIALSPRLIFEGHTHSYPKDLMLTGWGLTPGFECWKWR